MKVVTEKVKHGDTIVLPNGIETVEYATRSKGRSYDVFMAVVASSDSRYGTTEYTVNVFRSDTSEADDVDVSNLSYVEVVHRDFHDWIIVGLKEE